MAELGPEFQEYWDSYFANAPDKPVLWMGIGSTCVLQQVNYNTPITLLIITIIQVRRGLYCSPSAEILLHGSIYREPLIPSPLHTASNSRHG